jgi:hypothetical protein
MKVGSIEEDATGYVLTCHEHFPHRDVFVSPSYPAMLCRPNTLPRRQAKRRVVNSDSSTSGKTHQNGYTRLGERDFVSLAICWAMPTDRSRPAPFRRDKQPAGRTTQRPLHPESE